MLRNKVFFSDPDKCHHLLLMEDVDAYIDQILFRKATEPNAVQVLTEVEQCLQGMHDRWIMLGVI